MVAVRGPVGAHPPRPVRVLERVVEREHRDVLVTCDRGNQLVEPANVLLGVRPAVVPWKDVGEGDCQPELLAAAHHRAQVVGGALGGASLGDVVDAALDDQRLGAVGALVEARQDLVRTLAVDAAVTKLEAWVGARRPVFPLALLVAATA